MKNSGSTRVVKRTTTTTGSSNALPHSSKFATSASASASASSLSNSSSQSNQRDPMADFAHLETNQSNVQQLEDIIERIKNDSIQYVENMKALTSVGHSIADDFKTFYERTPNRLTGVSLKWEVVQNGFRGDKCALLEQLMAANVFSRIETFTAIIDDIHAKQKERATIKKTYGHYHVKIQELRAANEKKKRSGKESSRSELERLERNEKKYEDARLAYVSINNVLSGLLHDCWVKRFELFDPLFEQLVKTQSNFIQALSNQCQAVVPDLKAAIALPQSNTAEEKLEQYQGEQTEGDAPAEGEGEETEQPEGEQEPGEQEEEEEEEEDAPPPPKPSKSSKSAAAAATTNATSKSKPAPPPAAPAPADIFFNGFSPVKPGKAAAPTVDEADAEEEVEEEEDESDKKKKKKKDKKKKKEKERDEPEAPKSKSSKSAAAPTSLFANSPLKPTQSFDNFPAPPANSRTKQSAASTAAPAPVPAATSFQFDAFFPAPAQSSSKSSAKSSAAAPLADPFQIKPAPIELDENDPFAMAFAEMEKQRAANPPPAQAPPPPAQPAPQPAARAPAAASSAPANDVFFNANQKPAAAAPTKEELRAQAKAKAKAEKAAKKAKRKAKKKKKHSKYSDSDSSSSSSSSSSSDSSDSDSDSDSYVRPRGKASQAPAKAQSTAVTASPPSSAVDPFDFDSNPTLSQLEDASSNADAANHQAQSKSAAKASKLAQSPKKTSKSSSKSSAQSFEPLPAAASSSRPPLSTTASASDLYISSETPTHRAPPVPSLPPGGLPKPHKPHIQTESTHNSNNPAQYSPTKDNYDPYNNKKKKPDPADPFGGINNDPFGENDW